LRARSQENVLLADFRPGTRRTGEFARPVRHPVTDIL
jgi:hypothetical protein